MHQLESGLQMHDGELHRVRTGEASLKFKTVFILLRLVYYVTYLVQMKTVSKLLFSINRTSFALDGLENTTDSPF
jgi:hypothetical protein